MTTTTQITSMLMVSDRKDFWNASAFHDFTQWGKVASIGGETTLFDPVELIETLEHLKDQRILLLIHGYNDGKGDTIQEYFTVANHFSTPEGETPIFDRVIGYLWPGDGHFYEYFHAKEHTVVCAPLLKALLYRLSKVVKEINVLAHSMGNLLLLESVNTAPTNGPKNLIKNFYSFAPAIDYFSIKKEQNLFLSLAQIDEMIVFFSKRDPVEKWAYPTLELSEALGSVGDEFIKKLPYNVQMINCSALVSSHSGYFVEPSIFKWIEIREKQKEASCSLVREMTLNPDGTYNIILMRGQRGPISLRNRLEHFFLKAAHKTIGFFSRRF